MAEKQIVWIVGLIRTNGVGRAGSTKITIYGKEKDAVKEFKKRILDTMDSELHSHGMSQAAMNMEVERGLANRCYQYDDGEDIFVITLDSDVVN